MATKQKEVTTFDVQVADFIRNHKKQEQQQMMKSIQVWLFLLPLMQMALKTFCNGFRMLEFLSQIMKEIQVRVCLVQKKNQNSVMRT